MVADELLGSLVVEIFPTYESYLEGKITKKLLKYKGYEVKDILELVHSDLCDPMSIQARGYFKYFIYFIDNYLRYRYIYLMHRKTKCFD